MSRILVIDDERSIRNTLKDILEFEKYTVELAEDGFKALELLQTKDFDVILCDIKMPGMDGIEVLQKVEELKPDTPVVMISGHGNIDTAVESIKKGAFDFIEKPLDLNRLLITLRNAMDKSTLITETKVLRKKANKRFDIVGNSASIQKVKDMVDRVAATDARVLITGSNGTGKELVAHALHKHSPCAKGPFISLSTSAVPKDLLESELFGHERGAFPGAQTLRRGRFEQADGGTLFLGEVADLPFDLQTRLLRVLSDGHFYRIGGQDPIKANVRIIASTHQNLDARVAAGLFREDLLHRLNVIRLRMPSLRERSEDIPMLARHFMLSCAKSLGVEPKKLSDEVLKEISAMPFPGNVRQLENLCHWLTVMTPANVIGVSDLPADIVAQASEQPVIVHGESSPSNPVISKTASGDWESGLGRLAVKMLQDGDKEVFDALTARFEKAVLQAALEVTRGRRVEAAQRLGIGRNTITRKLQELGIDD